ncbi:ankyrin repeat-containing domain protein, partial [Lophiotrema nucula]
GHSDLVRFLIEADTGVNLLKGHYCTALQAAVVGGQAHIVSVLLEHGADVNLRAPKDKNAHYGAAISMASSRNRLDSVFELLMKNGANPHCATQTYGLALRHINSYKSKEVIESLLRFRADVNDAGG